MVRCHDCRSRNGIVESEEQRRAELTECVEYFMRLWHERIGGNGHDLITMLANGENTRDMDATEYLGNLLLLIVGGNDTTRNSMSGSIWSVPVPRAMGQGQGKSGPHSQHRRRDHSLADAAGYMRRTAPEDVEMHGKTIKKGDKVAMWYVSGNRDERKFENPDVLDFERKNARNHISFGFGIHRCFGNRPQSSSYRSSGMKCSSASLA